MLATTDNLALVKDILDRMLPSGDLQPLREGLADDVVFTVATPDGRAVASQGNGKDAILDYFESLGDMLGFWHARCSSSGARVIALIEERFTLEPGDMEVRSEFALLFDLRDGMITRLELVEESSTSTVAMPGLRAGAGVKYSARASARVR